jgi:AcrR family transcriptional regulator
MSKMVVSERSQDQAQEKPRALARRRQVLAAAATCFRRYGFHASSMAQIAKEAGMSVGHIYRYFVGKEAIIAAIVRADVEDILQKMADFPLDAPNIKANLIERCAEGVMKASDPEQAALMIEISAEAARNPKVWAVVKEVDVQLSAKMREIIAIAVGRPITPADLEARVEMFHLIFQGMGLRTVINAEIDREAQLRLVIMAINAILT